MTTPSVNSRISNLVLIIIFCAVIQFHRATSDTAAYVYWSDGDSGRIGHYEFRLANVDAPETGGVGSRSGAKCEAERELGYEAKAFMVELTKAKAVVVSRSYGEDRYGRNVVDLSVDGVDVATKGLSAGHLRPWPHKKGKAQSRKPNWC